MTEEQDSPPTRPSPTSDVDEQLVKVTNRWIKTMRRIVMAQNVLIVCLLGAVVYLLLGQASATDRTQKAAQDAITASDQRWCATMSLLTAHPVTPPANAAANPSREGQYELYKDFVSLRKEFGCDAKTDH